jgi:D-aminopeptidase
MDRRQNLLVSGIPVGKELTDQMPKRGQDGSIVVVIATDAPLDHLKLRRLASKASLGLARTGARSYHGSGDLFIAFSTGNRIPHYPKERSYTLQVIADAHMDPLFEAVEEATEEAILNALTMATTTIGRDGNTAHAIPLEALVSILRKYGQLDPAR